MITGLDESILPSLIGGEERILETYDEAIKASDGAEGARSELMSQRGQLQTIIEKMRRMELARP